EEETPENSAHLSATRGCSSRPPLESCRLYHSARPHAPQQVPSCPCPFLCASSLRVFYFRAPWALHQVLPHSRRTNTRAPKMACGQPFPRTVSLHQPPSRPRLRRASSGSPPKDGLPPPLAGARPPAGRGAARSGVTSAEADCERC
ncbi:hypothetical protein BESB_047950, partial [Besnoitia besnoiti]